MFQIYTPAKSESYWDGYTDAVDLVVFDDFHGDRQLRVMLPFLDGQMMRLSQRYSSYVKRKNVPIIVMSNFSPETVYRFPNRILEEAFVTRFTVIELDSFINIFQ